MALPQKTLNWLWDILRRDYRDAQRTYADLTQVLITYPNFTPRTDVYTSERGTSSLLLQLVGTVPVDFRGQQYRFPVAIWVPQTFPYDGPIAFVKPSDDMVIRPGQYVSGQDGRIYHPYLAAWREQWQRSTVTELLKILAGIFAQEPPVMSRQQTQVPQARQSVAGSSQPRAPPRLPPPSQDAEYTATRPKTNTGLDPAPPPPPPKHNGNALSPQTVSAAQPYTSRAGRYDAPPPLPDQMSRPQSIVTLPPERQPPQMQQYQGPRYSQSYLTQSPQHGQVPPIQPVANGQPQQLSYQRPPLPQQVYQQSPRQIQPSQEAQISSPQAQPLQQYGRHPPQQYTPGIYQSAQQTYRASSQQSRQQPQKPPAHSAPDLMDSPFDVSLATSSQNLPTPAIPPNPEKAHLLDSLSQALLQTLHQQLEQSTLCPPQSALQSELVGLRTLQGQLQNNIADLTGTLQKADSTVAKARTSAQDKKSLPNIDESIIPPTILARQLYEVVAEQRGYEAAVRALNEGLVRGRISIEIWGRRSRDVSREEFRRRWMIKRIGRGMGLDLSVMTSASAGEEEVQRY